VTACVGGGSNSLGIFTAFVPDPGVALIGYEAGGSGVEDALHAATIAAGRPGVLHGMRSYLLQDPDGQTLPTASISAGLDYPGVGPEHAWLYDTGRASYRSVTDGQAMEALRLLAHTEGILCAIETAHAVHGAVELARELGPEQVVLVCLSGRGDKDMDTAARWFDLLDPGAAG
jgi:tryptophan synthase beta chain